MTQSFTNLQPSLALTELILTSGVFPSGGGGGTASGDSIGFIYNFAGNYAPGGSDFAAGQLYSINANATLFSILGTNYGGDGVSNYLLPDLQGSTTIGYDASYSLAAATGSSTVTLTVPNLPAPSGTDQPIDNLQPSLPLETLICVGGPFPSQAGASGPVFLGQVAEFAGDYIPAGWVLAAGQTMSISGNTALFSILGTNYGGDGTTNFKLPDLQGKVITGADATHQVGATFGSATETLTTGNLPPTSGPVNNDQPSVAMEYLIATSGVFPTDGSASFSTTSPTLGEIVAFAGNYAPSGWAICDGSLLPISGNTALFSILGTTYGGDGVTSFALPDLRGRTIIGAGSGYTLGGVYGTDATALTAADIPVCYCAGTLIQTPAGQVPVERLAIGDEVETLHGGRQRIKWIGQRGYVAPFCNHPAVLPVRIQAGAIADGVPARDLFVSPGHAICIDNALIHAMRLVNGVTITQAPYAEAVTYFHLELDSHEVLFAENCPAESFRGEEFRARFHNAAAYARMYPGHSAPAVACLPFLDAGFQLEAILGRLRRRAGVSRPALPGPLYGYVDVANAADCAGWAVDEAAPGEAVCLEILAAGQVVGRVIANGYRADVALAGFGTGHHGFTFAVPPGTRGPLAIRRAADRARLPHAA